MRIQQVVTGIVAGLLSLPAAAPLEAQDLTVGTQNTVNTAPFGFYAQTPPNRYQQVYAAASFPSAILIDAFRLTPISGTDAISPGNYVIRFSTTTRGVDALSETFDANLGVNTQTFHSGLLGGGVRVVGSSPYLFDPALGNLLLDVQVLSQTPPGPPAFTLFAASNDETDAMSRVHQPGQGTGPADADSFGLITTFEYRAATTVPEPSTLVLLGTALVGVALVRTRHARR
jgi:hypothetical protein